MINLILGLLLHYANRRPSILYKTEFYALKTKLLLKRGIRTGTSFQHIKKECFRCDHGMYYSHYWATYERCWDCCGTGVYEEFWTELANYRLGKYSFHIPIARYYMPPDFNTEPIEGYIRHTAPKYYIANECCYWLFLLYDRPTFVKFFIKSTSMSVPLRNIRTPLIFIHTLIVAWRESRLRSNEEEGLPF